MVARLKRAAAMGSALSDPSADDAAVQPIPTPVISNKPAPGQRGPIGLAPRTTYSRVNTGTPPDPGSAVMDQKTAPPPVPTMLKSAERCAYKSKGGDMGDMHALPTVQEMIKAAMQGTLAKINVGRVAEPQEEKTAEAEVSFSTEQLRKLADAADFVAAKLASDLEGPGSLHVMKAEADGPSLQPNQTGAAHHQPEAGAPKEEGQTKLKTNEDYLPPKLPADPLNGKTAAANLNFLLKLAGTKTRMSQLSPVQRRAEVSKRTEEARVKSAPAAPAVTPPKAAPAAVAATEAASKAAPAAEVAKKEPGWLRRAGTAVTKHWEGASNKRRSLYVGGSAAPVLAAGAYGLHRALSHKKESSALTSSNLQLLYKMAGDVPPAASASEQDVPPQPVDVERQMKLVGSNAAAIDYTKRDAKADPKSDANKMLTEPAQTKATDHTLQQAFAHTEQSGAKISSAVPTEKLAAAKALLSRLQQEVGGRVAAIN